MIVYELDLESKYTLIEMYVCYESETRKMK